MTDAEIIKALECCNTEDENGFANCDDCPYYAKGMCLTCPEIFDLINRQKSEIESLNVDLNKKVKELESITEKFNCQQYVYADLSDIIREKNAEIENQSENLKKLVAEHRKLQTDYSSMQSTLAKMSVGVEEAKAEAIKEFSERLKQQVEMISYEMCSEYQETIDAIDNLVKEMVGEG